MKANEKKKGTRTKKPKLDKASDGEDERAIKTMKAMRIKAEDERDCDEVKKDNSTQKSAVHF